MVTTVVPGAVVGSGAGVGEGDGFEGIDTLVTDAPPPDPWPRILAAKGVKTLVSEID